MTLRPALCLVFALATLTLTARADVSQSADTQRVYVGSGQSLTVTAARQLTLNAFVKQVLYQPGSLEAAYTGLTLNGDTATTWVRVVGLRTGETTTLLSTTGPMDGDDSPSAYKLEGWSGDGRYLIVSHKERQEFNNGMTGGPAPVWDSVDIGTIPFTVHRIPFPLLSSTSGSASGNMLPSLSGNVFALQWDTPGINGTAPFSEVFLYEVAKGTLRRIRLPEHSLFMGWHDDANLRLYRSLAGHSHYIALDIHTNMVTPAKGTPAQAPSVPRRFPEVTLSVLPVPLDIPGPSPQSRAAGSSLWLHITGKRPKLPAVCLAVFTGYDDPNPVLAPDQSSVLWLSRGDLFLSRFSVDAANVREKYDNGEALTCDEERQIAESNAKQIGLGIIQYTQDYDEQFPPAANFHDGVYPYIKSEGEFHVRQYPFQYAAPADLHLSAMDAPADIVLGTIALPCATVTLYADGHVKSLPPANPVR